ncbi:MAG: hypothetical protein M3Q07_13365 [Pseudobdellovibrionaceae bacterium]|nr:hypothetical protein [Pseudobdellovibrionaceae bacterium]
MKLAAAIAAIVCLKCSIAMSAIVENSDPKVELDLTSYSQDYRYRVTVTRAVTPKKMTGNPFRDSYLQVSCGENVLGKDPQRITSTSFGKVMTFRVVFDVTSQVCPEFKFQTALETNGTIVESPRVEYDVIPVRQTVPAFIKQVRGEMPVNKQDIVYYHGEMSKALGSRVSLHCLIKDYESDPNVADTIIPDLVTYYKNSFGVEYKGPDLDCKDPPKLDKEIAECSTNPNLRRNFCSNYKLYAMSLGWFSSSIAAAREQKTTLLTGESSLATELDDLISELEKAEKDAKAQTETKPEPQT